MNLARATRLGFVLTLVGIAGAAGSSQIRSGDAGATWTKVSWPFLLDQWGTGQAFRCEHQGCGGAAQLFVRVKRGFCNCFQGVADDAEVDRLTDFEFLGGASQPIGAGRRIRLDDLAGRMRAFTVDGAQAPTRRAVSLILAKDCDALVATWISEDARADVKGPESLPRTVLAGLR
jgi:hypothetical protein